MFRVSAWRMLIVLIGSAAVGWVWAGQPELAWIKDAVVRIARQILARAEAIPPNALKGGIFLSGLMLGWVSAMWWASRNWRRSSLLIADLRYADMPLAEGIRHVRVHAFPPVADDAAAISLLLREAARGRITLWHRHGSEMLGRVSPLGIRATIARIRLVSSTDRWNMAHGSGFLLLSAEVERLWPTHKPLARGTDLRIITAA